MLGVYRAAATGMVAHQQLLDVISNNIANISTPGFKFNRAVFQDLLYQTLKPATSPTTTIGGQNPVQVGNGSKLGTIDTIQTQGALQSTGRPTDIRSGRPVG